MPLSQGDRLGRYEILGPLGAGGMGEVYRARDLGLEREIALKVLPAETLTDEMARARMLREARMAARLNHPHVCTVHEVGEADGQVYIAMELVEGENGHPAPRLLDMILKPSKARELHRALVTEVVPGSPGARAGLVPAETAVEEARVVVAQLADAHVHGQHLRRQVRRHAQVLAAAGIEGVVVESASVPGAGSVPGAAIPSPALQLAADPDAAWRRLAAAPVAIIGRRHEGACLIDLRTVDPDDDPLTITVAGLPTGATFDPARRRIASSTSRTVTQSMQRWSIGHTFLPQGTQSKLSWSTRPEPVTMDVITATPSPKMLNRGTVHSVRSVSVMPSPAAVARAVRTRLSCDCTTPLYLVEVPAVYRMANGSSSSTWVGMRTCPRPASAPPRAPAAPRAAYRRGVGSTGHEAPGSIGRACRHAPRDRRRSPRSTTTGGRSCGPRGSARPLPNHPAE